MHRTGATKLSEMGGMARSMPTVTGAFILGALSIAGLPPLNGYVSLSLIHQALLASRQAVPYALMLAAQVITVAALGRAAWLAFFRRPARAVRPRERLRPGMLAGLAGLGGGCVAFGAAGPVVLRTLMAPAASGLLHASRYASGVLDGRAHLAPAGVPFDYLSAGELTSVAATLAVAAVLARGYLRRREPRLISRLRAVHTGSANDYAGYAMAGTLAVIAVLSLG